MAADKGFRPLGESAGAAIYKDACRSAAKPDSVSLDLSALKMLLAAADQIASTGSSDLIRRADIEDAARELQKSHTP